MTIRLARRALLAGAAAAVLSCAAPAPPGPPAPAPQAATVSLKPVAPPPDLGPVDRYAWLSVAQLGEAYRQGDVEGFLGRFSRGFYRGYPALESALRAHLAGTTDRAAVVAVDGVTTEGERVSVAARWERALTRGGVPEARAGATVFLFLRSDTSLRLLDFRGDAPFGIEGIPELP